MQYRVETEGKQMSYDFEQFFDFDQNEEITFEQMFEVLEYPEQTEFEL